MVSILSTRHHGVRVYFMCCLTLSLTCCYFFLKLATNTGYCCHIIFLPLNLCLLLQLIIYLLTGWLTDPMSDFPQPYTEIESSWSQTTRNNSKLMTVVKLNTQHLQCIAQSYSYLVIVSLRLVQYTTSRAVRILLANDVCWSERKST